MQHHDTKARKGLLITLLFLASSIQASAMILPRNNLHRFDRRNFIANITEQQFNAIIDAVAAYWKPIAASYGATLVVNKDWADSTVNAYANQSGSTWELHFFGGLARRPELTPDGFALVVCHELGHHFGGHPFYPASWAASEGEADYFATQVCAHRIWANAPGRNSMIWRARIAQPTQASQKCDATWGTPADRAICYRSAEAGTSLAKLLGTASGDPQASVDTPDPTRVAQTVYSHPAAQCRLDTYFQGALCTEKFDLNVIPGKSLSDPNGPDAEREAVKYSCAVQNNYRVGLRPRCWFNSIVNPDFRPRHPVPLAWNARGRS